MSFGFFTQNNKWQTYIDSNERLEVLCAYAEVDYNVLCPASDYPHPTDPDWTILVPDPKYFVGHHVVVDLKKVFPCQIFDYANGTDLIQSDIPPFANAKSCRKNNEFSIYIGTSSGNPATVCGKLLANGVVYEPTASGNCKVSVSIGSATPNKVSNPRIQGRLWVAVFTKLPVNLVKPNYGLQLFNRDGICNFSSFYEPLAIHGYVRCPPYQNSTYYQPNSRVAIPNHIAGEKYLSPDGLIAYVDYLNLDRENGTVIYNWTCDPDGTLYRGVSWLGQGGSYGNIATTNFDAAQNIMIPVLKVSDYFTVV